MRQITLCRALPVWCCVLISQMCNKQHACAVHTRKPLHHYSAAHYSSQQHIAVDYSSQQYTALHGKCLLYCMPRARDCCTACLICPMLWPAVLCCAGCTAYGGTTCMVPGCTAYVPPVWYLIAPHMMVSCVWYLVVPHTTRTALKFVSPAACFAGGPPA